MDHQHAAAPLARLIDELHRLPGVGPKTAQRLAYYIVRAPKEEVRSLAEALAALKEEVFFCSQCHNLTDVEPCAICSDTQRDRSTLCVVEQALDILALERTRRYKGQYHVLHGAISPMNGVGPGDLTIAALEARLRSGAVKELILATNPNLEGEATAAYILRQIRALPIAVTRLARGLPSGADLEYADEVTLARAIEGRQAMS